MRTRILVLALFLVAATSFADSKDCPVTFGYSGFAGPSQWKNLEGSAVCGSGTIQSPIKLENPRNLSGDRLRFDYKKSGMKLLNSGHDFRAILPDDVTNLVFPPGMSDAGYRLDNFHFHTPNEHVLPHHDFQGELHMVHKRGDEVVVVAFFIRVGEKKNEALDPVISKLPLSLCKSEPIEFDPNALLKTARNVYYSYIGSLTTPKCDEGVHFFIYPAPIEVSQSQFDRLAKFGKNARPLQKNTNRVEFVTAK